jgi:hypothetical protein
MKWLIPVLILWVIFIVLSRKRRLDDNYDKIMEAKLNENI